MPKKIFFDADARNRILEGAGILYRAVSKTMSPMGRNVVIKKPYGHTITHDGVTVAENVVLENQELAVGADIIKEAAGKLNNEVGDGTTSVTVLTYQLMEAANQLIVQGMNAMEVRAALEQCRKLLIKKLKTLTIPLTDRKLIDVATISAGDAELGKIIGELALEVGTNGTIAVEQGRGYKTEREVQKGFVFNRSYLSPYFITDQKKKEVVLEKPVIIITNEKLSTFEQLNGLFAEIGKDDKAVLLICDELTGEALTTIVQKHIQGARKFAVVQAPNFGDSRREMLEDIATYTGGIVHDPNKEMFFTNGHAEKIIISREQTTIINGSAHEQDVAARLAAIDQQIEDTDSDYEKEQLAARKANLVGKVGIIKVGGASESEVDEKKYRVDDAVAAVKAAQRGGIVAGGGVTLFNLAEEIDDAKIDKRVIGIVQSALQSPLRVITENANLSFTDVAESIKGTRGRGVDVTKGDKIISLVRAGIVDPSRVTEQVINSSFSIAMTAITIDVLVVDVPDEE